jgi:hypothetical protein
VLEPDREPQEALADAHFRAHFRRETLMRGRRRMGEETLHVAEVVGNADQP